MMTWPWRTRRVGILSSINSATSLAVDQTCVTPDACLIRSERLNSRNEVVMAKAILGNHASACATLGLCIALAAVVVAASPVLEAGAAGNDAVKNIVLVHGANTDGSGWRGVYDILTKHGYHVSVVQQPLTGLSDDVAATKRVIDQQDGPIILVGHSYGGSIITV